METQGFVRRRARARLIATFGVMTLAAAALVVVGGCGSAKPARGFRPEVIGASLGTGEDLTRALGRVEVLLDGPGGDEPVEATRRRLEDRLRELLARRGYFVDGGRPETVLRFEIRTAGDATERTPGHEKGWAEDWAPIAVAGATRVQRTARREAVAKGAAPVPEAGPRVSLEVLLHGIQAWRGEARIDPAAPDVVAASEPALRTLVWHLPGWSDGPRPAETVEPGEIVARYADECAERPLLSPVLPYPVHFPALEAGYHRSAADPVEWEGSSTARIVERGDLLPTWRRLLETADRAFPTGGGATKRPFDPVAWEKVTIVGEVVADGETLTLAIDVADVPSGYVVKGCRVVGFLEKPKLTKRLEAWEEAARRARE